jgi:hypothetical protein
MKDYLLELEELKEENKKLNNKINSYESVLKMIDDYTLDGKTTEINLLLDVHFNRL